MRKPTFCICENKGVDSCKVTVHVQLISAFAFATSIVQSLYFLNLKFQASSYLLRLYSAVCFGTKTGFVVTRLNECQADPI